MNFEGILKELTERAGGLAAVIMGRDGIALGSYKKEDCRFNVEDLTIEYSSILREIEGISYSQNAGRINELSFCTDTSKAVFRSINEDYFITLFANKDAYLGKLRFALRLAVDKAKKEL